MLAEMKHRKSQLNTTAHVKDTYARSSPRTVNVLQQADHEPYPRRAWYQQAQSPAPVVKSCHYAAVATPGSRRLSLFQAQAPALVTTGASFGSQQSIAVL